MSTNTTDNPKKVTVTTVAKMKHSGEKISMITAYDYTMAQLVDAAGVDMILVGDSAANVMAGYESTIPMTLDHMIYHGQCVVRGATRAMVIVDMPFGSYQGNPSKGLESAIRIIKETGAAGVKLEGGESEAETIRKIVEAGIPVCGHLGLTPQSVNAFGGYGVRAKTDAEAKRLHSDAHLLQELGCFAIVFEKIPAQLAAEISAELSVPTIGIGAGSGTDGQVLVLQDMLGMNDGFRPKFLRRYADVGQIITQAVGKYVSDVRNLDFPSAEECY